MSRAFETGFPASGGLALVERCRQADESAWRTLFDEHFDFVWRTARRLGTPEAELEDVCQEVFLVVFRKLDGFREGLLTTWLYRITANVVSARHRRRRLRRALHALFAASAERTVCAPMTPEELLGRSEAARFVAEILEVMSPRKREVFALFELEGLSGDEIAERVGCKVETVWSRLYYARREFACEARRRGLLEERGGSR